MDQIMGDEAAPESSTHPQPCIQIDNTAQCPTDHNSKTVDIPNDRASSSEEEFHDTVNQSVGVNDNEDVSSTQYDPSPPSRRKRAREGRQRMALSDERVTNSDSDGNSPLSDNLNATHLRNQVFYPDNPKQHSKRKRELTEDTSPDENDSDKIGKTRSAPDEYDLPYQHTKLHQPDNPIQTAPVTGEAASGSIIDQGLSGHPHKRTKHDRQRQPSTSPAPGHRDTLKVTSTRVSKKKSDHTVKGIKGVTKPSSKTSKISKISKMTAQQKKAHYDMHPKTCRSENRAMDTKEKHALDLLHNQFGIRVMEEIDMSTPIPLIAGYMGFSNTNEYEEWLDRDIIVRIVSDFVGSCDANFGIPLAKVSGRVLALPQKKVVFAALQPWTDDLRALEPHSLDGVQKLIFGKDDMFTDAMKKTQWKFQVNNTSGISAVLIASMYRLIRSSPEEFMASRDLTDTHSSGCGPYDPEDLHRAYGVLVTEKKRKSGKGKEKDMTENTQAAQIRMRDPSTTVAPSIADKTQHHAGSMALDYARWSRDTAALNLPSAAELRDTILMYDPHDPLQKADREKALLESTEQVKSLSAYGGASVTARDTAPAHLFSELNDAARKSLLESLLKANEANQGVLHDAFSSNHVNDADDETTLQQHLRESLFEAHAETGEADESSENVSSEDLKDATDIGTDERRAFWRLREDIASTENVNLDFEAALTNLGFPTAVELKGTVCVRKHPMLSNNPSIPSPLVPSSLNILTASYMKNQEGSAIRSGIIRHDCGTGKTISALLHIVLQAVSIEAVIARDPSTQHMFKPTLICCPSGVVGVWIAEFETYFQGALRLFVWFGNDNDASSTYAKYSVSGSVDDAVDQLKRQCPPEDLRSGRTIILSPYETWSRRTLTNRAELAERLALQFDSGADDQAVLDPAPPKTRRTNPQSVAEIKAQAAADAVFQDENARYEELAQTSSEKNSDSALKDVVASRFRFFFCRVICDEGHKVKNSSTGVHRSIFTLYADHVWILTATPMVNRASDLLGYLNLFWRTSWRDDYTPDLGLIGCYDEDRRADMHSVESLPDTWNGAPLYVLDPKSFAKLVNKNMLMGETARKVLRSIMPLIQFRLTMATKISSYGVVERIGASIPPYKITTTELRMTKTEEKLYKTIWDDFAPLLNSSGGIGGGGHEKAKPVADAGGLRNMHIHRLLSLVSFDLRLFNMIQRMSREASSVKGMEKMIHGENDHGQMAYHMWTKDNSLDPPYLDPFSKCYYQMAYSPKLRYMAKLIYEGLYVDDLKGKTLIFCNWPIEQWCVDMFLHTLGIPFYSLRSSTSKLEREASTGKFNNLADPVQFMTATIKGSGVGLNLQNACHRVVMVGVPDNVNLIIQGFGRVNRKGQTKIQLIWILGLDHSYDQVLQHTIMTKMNVQLCGDANLNELNRNSPEFQELVEQAKAKLHDPAAEPDPQAVANEFVSKQVDQLLIKILGMRCSRSEWGNRIDLSSKDSSAGYMSTPRKLRTTLVPNPSSRSSGPDSSPSRAPKDILHHAFASSPLRQIELRSRHVSRESTVQPTDEAPFIDPTPPIAFPSVIPSSSSHQTVTQHAGDGDFGQELESQPGAVDEMDVDPDVSRAQPGSSIGETELLSLPPFEADAPEVYSTLLSVQTLLEMDHSVNDIHVQIKCLYKSANQLFDFDEQHLDTIWSEQAYNLAEAFVTKDTAIVSQEDMAHFDETYLKIVARTSADSSVTDWM